MLLLSELERHVLVERQVAAALIAAGADMEAPTFLQSRWEFDTELAAAPVPESDQARLLRKLGV